MNADVIKVDSLVLNFWHVDHDGKRVTFETCTCSQCAMQRAMQTRLNAIDRTYEREYVTDRASMARAARLLAERRQAIVDTFIKAGFVGCTMPMFMRIPMRVEQEQIEVARDAWQEDEGASGRWREMLKEHPVAIQNYIGKRFEKERADLEGMPETSFASNQRFRITSLSYARGADGWEVTDNTPGF